MQQHKISELRNSYNTYSCLLRGIKRYNALHNSYSSDMKMMLMADKISLLIIAANQAMQGEITDKISNAEKECPIPEDLLKNFAKLRIEIDEVFDSVITDLKELISKIGGIDSLYERVDQKLDMILSSPDYVPGQKMMNNSKQHYEKLSQ